MESVGKIALLLPELVDPLDYEFARSVQNRAQQLGFDLLLLTGVVNSQLESQRYAYVQGLENIYSLLRYSQLNGVLFAVDRFHNEALIEEIYDILSQTGVPCLAVGGVSEKLPFLTAQETDGMYAITKHMIEVHSFQKLYCIAGVPDNKPSEERLNGFCRAMSEAGLSYNSETIFYGYYWSEIPREIGEKIANGVISMPEAVVCASDHMAAALIETLQNHGIRVPEDIAVSGFDDSWDAFFHSITTVAGRERQLGVAAVNRLYEMITGHRIEGEETPLRIHYGTSCGCGRLYHSDEKISGFSARQQVKKNVERALQRQMFMTADYFDKMTNVKDLDEWIIHVDESAHVLRDWQGIDICLCEDWQFNYENPQVFRQVGFSKTMFLALSKRYGDNAPGKYRFQTKNILPSLMQPHEPVLIVFTSLHYRDQIFGYMASYCNSVNDVDLNGYYMTWCDAAANGLNVLQQARRSQYVNEQRATYESDPVTGLLSKHGITEKMVCFLEFCRTNYKLPLLFLATYLQEDEADKFDIMLDFARSVQETAPPYSLTARLNGNIFAILLPTDSRYQKEQAEAKLAERLGTKPRDTSSKHIPLLCTSETNLNLNDAAEAVLELEKAVTVMTEKAEYETNRFADYQTKFRKLRREIMMMPQKEWSIEKIAHDLNFSRSHFQRLYQRFFHVNCLDDIIQARIEKACQLLIHTNMQINDICIACGYQSKAYFMRQFKEKTGMTALQYRKTAKEI